MVRARGRGEEGEREAAHHRACRLRPATRPRRDSRALRQRLSLRSLLDAGVESAAAWGAAVRARERRGGALHCSTEMMSCEKLRAWFFSSLRVCVEALRDKDDAIVRLRDQVSQTR